MCNGMNIGNNYLYFLKYLGHLSILNVDAQRRKVDRPKNIFWIQLFCYNIILLYTNLAMETRETALKTYMLWEKYSLKSLNMQCLH